ncbi:hypothetical protein BOTBODRAFT_47432 [Botryobasidium botryosum FD-172 SS1]|uniref:Uncharacterized protein n=1 Tax=Botryobasidium botryosum (strain FD-172 SS1) TaxID=930990 RepID=A0A067M281_BOTB1|nr:hypothetical protein BOTBODRAFT_47432 [Botryobasidium botryosum FD-172 SS1]
MSNGNLYRPSVYRGQSPIEHLKAVHSSGLAAALRLPSAGVETATTLPAVTASYPRHLQVIVSPPRTKIAPKGQENTFPSLVWHRGLACKKIHMTCECFFPTHDSLQIPPSPVLTLVIFVGRSLKVCKLSNMLDRCMPRTEATRESLRAQIEDDFNTRDHDILGSPPPREDALHGHYTPTPGLRLFVDYRDCTP